MITSFTGYYSFLSNFHHCRIIMEDGIIYPSAEHAYQAMKTQDLVDRAAISCLSTPGDAKRYGRRIKPLPKDWDNNRIAIMRHIIYKKFSNSPTLFDALLKTGGQYLIEGNAWGDQFWGATQNFAGEWAGENWLGRILMDVRKDLRDGIGN